MGWLLSPRVPLTGNGSNPGRIMISLHQDNSVAGRYAIEYHRKRRALVLGEQTKISRDYACSLHHLGFRTERQDKRQSEREWICGIEKGARKGGELIG
jgi:hypothetical protein